MAEKKSLSEKMAEKKSLSEKMAELDDRVEWFSSEEFKLEEAVEKYKQAIDLAKEVETELVALKNEIEVLAVDFSK